MRIGTLLRLGVPWRDLLDEVVALERAGLDIVWVPEAYGFDAVSLLGAIAARTERIGIGSGVLPVYTRTPTLLAMTAAGIDTLSDGRFELGLGSSGPQVVEGWHGLAFDAPLGRTREVVDICRAVWRREEPLRHDGTHYRLPRPPRDGRPSARALKLIDRPVRPRVPIVLAALGPANVAMAAEVAEGWLPAMFWPERADRVWAEPLRTGTARRAPELGALDVIADASLLICDRDGPERDADRRPLAHYFGGMGAVNRNFYRMLLERYGYPTEAEAIQRLYLSGRKKEAAALVPAELVAGTSLVGDEAFISDRLHAYHEAGVTTLNVTPTAHDRATRTRHVARLRELAEEVAG
jgi:F420-dependent oxidoreductase-like protein